LILVSSLWRQTVRRYYHLLIDDSEWTGGAIGRHDSCCNCYDCRVMVIQLALSLAIPLAQAWSRYSDRSNWTGHRETDFSLPTGRIEPNELQSPSRFSKNEPKSDDFNWKLLRNG
jgi:hypothetical protein